MFDPLHQESGPTSRWTTVNAAEALPGVSTPLNWTVFGARVERAFRGTFADMGVIPAGEVKVPESVDDRLWGVFHGRAAANLDTFRRLADLTPGTSGDALEEQLFGTVRPGVQSARSRRRYPAAALRMPAAAVRLPKVLARQRAEIDAFWRRPAPHVGGRRPPPIRRGPRPLRDRHAAPHPGRHAGSGDLRAAPQALPRPPGGPGSRPG